MKRTALVIALALGLVLIVGALATLVLADTPSGQARITYPYDGTQVSGKLQIKGLVGITNPEFSFYKVEFGLGENPPGFGAVSGTKSTLPSDGVLDTWDTTQWPDGPVTFKLTVVDNTANYLTDQLSVIVNNHPQAVGSQTCKACHSNVYASWQGTNHGKNNIGCESCHGAGGAHVASGGNTALIGKSFDSGVCATCHKDTFAAWSTSKHTVLSETGIDEESPCNTCHTGQGFVTAQINKQPYTPAEHYQTQTCATCHDPHSAANPGQLRAVGTAKVTSGTTKDWGLGAQCAMCHNERRDAANVKSQVEKSFSRGPHEGTSADMLAGTGAYEYPGITFGDSAHTAAAKDACVTCHVNPGANHKFEPQLAACQTCHGANFSSFDVAAKGDYDGNGKVESVQKEVAGLMALVAAQLPAGEWTNNPKLDTKAKRAAAYNYLFVERDRSEGVHNTTYAVQLLQGAYRDLTGKNVPNATLLIK